MDRIIIVGSGLVGSLLSIFLARRDYSVQVFDKKPDLRTSPLPSGRSINLTICHRGFQALDRVGAGDRVRAISTPAYGRRVHGENGEVVFQPYGNRGEALHAITRNELNRVLLDVAAKQHGVEFRFRHKCLGIDLSAPALTFENLDTGQLATERPAVVLGADGAFSTVRQQMLRSERFDCSQEYIQQGYKELTIPSGVVRASGLERHALHIWPRGRYMLIGFANFDGSTTLALHLPYEGSEPSFASIRSESDLLGLFARSFPDALPLLPQLVGNYFGRPVSSMLTVRCFPWVRGKVALIGDAAHAIVPSYGQGANAGFEDCAVLDAALDRHAGDWEKALADYQRERKPNADLIAGLSLQHFSEIRDRLNDPRFLIRKAVERRLDEIYPGRFTSLYSLISFTGMSYVEALARTAKQEAIVDRILTVDDLAERFAQGTMDAVLHEHACGDPGAVASPYGSATS
ncbi:MAG TPA: NAD(P)/FAD-dependent oxidoreductase [Thermoanaerobaculia bacterium]|nr:NAD(P)/FAD-dependent oxidoreductase [Thermoanaerobaculia bacterium]